MTLLAFLMADQPNQAQRLPFTSILKGDQSGVLQPLEIVVRTQRDWGALWQKHNSTRAKDTPPPIISFDKELVIAVFLGTKPTGGYEVEIVRVEKDAGSISVSYVEKRPPPDGVVTQALTQPFHIVRFVDQRFGTFSFRRLP